ncbi:uncharacterized protein ASCRUDRAFT_5755 [Ascoidea rubescens DSM 1968]|uniref:Uncharacterized protein n=1 Tax=Ascoidea rubescens DSM 1968 TaxID=1344418 RepID=A0A1D2VQF2_9ASCO|nr:hypothetical protein ASCRUDRAFT_5755 [Ascoidea rubescens DSM 1968]ODV63831.1 hypothetical protein ASCRUDRAFT_5755 [Ascoidea rubescens DSM 1968]
MRVRKSVLLAFIIANFIALYLGLAEISLPNDKLLHFVVFFILTSLFYWTIDTNSTKKLRLVTFVSCSITASILSEFFQNIISSTRKFDINDILFNFLGSTLSLLISTFLHKKLIQKKRLDRIDQLHQYGREHDFRQQLIQNGEYFNDNASIITQTIDVDELIYGPKPNNNNNNNNDNNNDNNSNNKIKNNIDLEIGIPNLDGKKIITNNNNNLLAVGITPTSSCQSSINSTDNHNESTSANKNDNNNNKDSRKLESGIDNNIITSNESNNSTNIELSDLPSTTLPLSTNTTSGNGAFKE